VKITVRKASAAILGAAIAHGSTACSSSAQPQGEGVEVASQSAAYSVADPGEATLRIEYRYDGNAQPTKGFYVYESTTDELVRTGQKLTLEIPGWHIGALLGTEQGYPTGEEIAKLKTTLEITWLRGAATTSKTEAKIARFRADGEYSGYPDAISEVITVPAGATAMRLTLVVTSADGTRTRSETLRDLRIFGGELPNKTLFFDENGSRVAERGAPIAGSELTVAYSEGRAVRLVDPSTIDRSIGRVKVYNPRFGTTESTIFGELVHVITVGYQTGDGVFREQQLVQSASPLVRYGRTQETRIFIPEGTEKVSLYFNVKTYLVAKYPSYGEVTDRRYQDGQWILVRERWDNPNGANTNFELSTEKPEPRPAAFERTVVLVRAETAPGQDLFVRGGIDHVASRRLRGVLCEDERGAPNYACAIPIVHRNLKNDSSRAWKLGDAFLDWYGREPTQFVGNAAGIADGSAADWTTQSWPSIWGAERTVAKDGFGVEPLNTFGDHYWMLDVDMDCTKAFRGADGTRWFEVKTFVTNGPGWEPDVRQGDAPYASSNHFAKCGQLSVFQRGNSSVSYRRLR
jgi:hypothetical protein